MWGPRFPNGDPSITVSLPAPIPRRILRLARPSSGSFPITIDVGITRSPFTFPFPFALALSLTFPDTLSFSFSLLCQPCLYSPQQTQIRLVHKETPLLRHLQLEVSFRE